MNGNFEAKCEDENKVVTMEEAKKETASAPEEKKPARKQTKTTKPMNIFQRLLAVENALAIVAKNLTVSTGGRNSYRAVSERDIIDAVKPLEVEYGVYSYPVSREILESHILESENEYQGKVTKKSTFMTRVKTVYRFVNVDEPTDFIETTVFSEGIDAQDKGSGKAMTYGDKYALMKMYKISTGDDPDQQASEPTNYRTAGSQPRQQPAQTAAPAQSAQQRPAATGGTWGSRPAQAAQPAQQRQNASGWSNGNSNGQSGSGWGRRGA